MGRDVYETSAAARAIFEEADRVLGYKLSEVCFAGPAERLNDTTVAQPAVLATSVALFEAMVESVTQKIGRRVTDGSEPRGVMALPEHLRPAFVAGHSLGEFTALVTAGVLPFADALRLVAERGKLASTRGARGAMAAIIGLSAAEVESVIAESVEPGTVVVANDNGPMQVTIAGDDAGIRVVTDALTKRGAKKIVPLRISAPFHFPEMGRIGPDLRAFMQTLRFREPVVPIVANVSALPHLNGPAIQEALVRHLSHRVECVRGSEGHQADRSIHALRGRRGEPGAEGREAGHDRRSGSHRHRDRDRRRRSRDAHRRDPVDGAARTSAPLSLPRSDAHGERRVGAGVDAVRPQRT